MSIPRSSPSSSATGRATRGTVPAAALLKSLPLFQALEHFSRLLHQLAEDGLLRIEGRRITLLQPQRCRPP